MSSEGSDEESLKKNWLSNQHHAPLPQVLQTGDNKMCSCEALLCGMKVHRWW